jgi:hypothetical protein
MGKKKTTGNKKRHCRGTPACLQAGELAIQIPHIF